MNAQEQLRQAIDLQGSHLRAGLPAGRTGSIVALVPGIDRLSKAFDGDSQPDLITGRRLAVLGGNKALQYCLDSTADAQQAGQHPASTGLDTWAEKCILDSGSLAEAELVLGHCETGFMRVVEGSREMFDAWIATKRVPTSWRERADIDWWTAWLAKRDGSSSLPSRAAAATGASGGVASYRRIADAYVEQMAYQPILPLDTLIGGCTIRLYRDVLGWLIAMALEARDRGEDVAPQSEQALVATLASVLRADPSDVRRAVAGFTLEQGNAAYHAAVPGVAAAPLVRVDRDRLIWSMHGLTTEPLLFLSRELRHRAAQEYHNVAFLREDVFRQDLYSLFNDKRFVTSAGRIELRRQAGDIRTDIDAVVFDRKTGTLGCFELKSQDPFARSTAELVRQRDNFLYANRQVSGVLAWLNRQGAGDELLNRVNSRTAKSFRVHNVYPFVLGRYLAHFNDGPEPDRRAAWGTWPQVLRLLGGQPASGANPIASLFTRLTKDAPSILPSADASPQVIDLGDARLTVHASYAAYQASAAVEHDQPSQIPPQPLP